MLRTLSTVPRSPLLVPLLLLAACGPTSASPALDPAMYLRVGVDLEQEVPRVIRSMDADGYRVTSRVEGESFVALGGIHDESDATEIRVVTRAGVAMPLRAPDVRRPERRRVTLAPAREGDADLDGDGLEEVLIVLVSADRPRPCLGLLRVGPSGGVFEVPLPALQVSDRACAERLEDVLGDARAELLVRLEFPGLAALDPSPFLEVPLLASEGRWSLASTAEGARYWEQQVLLHEAALVDARERAVPALGLRLAVELAAISLRIGGDSDAQLAAFDGALAGFVFGESMLGQLRDGARGYIGDGWASDPEH